ncbi:MAG: tyrosine-type recombinase/integrase [Caulobacteraceae bacterium]
MPLSDLAVRTAKPREKQFKLADSGGLYLLVRPSGGKLWRMKYRFGGVEQLLAFGQYPDVSLKAARARRDAARKLITDGKNPLVEKKLAIIAEKVSAANTFKLVAEEVIAKAEQEGAADATLRKARWMASLLEPALGERPVAQISAAELHIRLKEIEKAGHRETAVRLRAFASRVFRYAVATQRADRDPASDLRGALVSPRVKHYAAILDPAELGALLRAIDGFEGQPATKLALRLAPHVFVRPGELRQAEWKELDLTGATWRIPAGRMKMREPHDVPLSRQAVLIFKEAKLLAGTSRYVFPSVRSLARPMSDNTLNAALRRLGYSADEMTTHGFRSTASTLLNEAGCWSPDAIERALAHKDSSVRGIYHRGGHWNERVQMTQWWSDYLDVLREGSDLAPKQFAAAL